MRLYKQSPQTLQKASAFLKDGGVVICPTDTVYGFLADAGNKKAVERIFKIKKRPRSKPLSLFVKDIKMAHELALINEEQAEMLRKHWPGKYTFILNRKSRPEAHPRGNSPRVRLGVLYGVDKKTIALRIPNFKFLNNVLKKVNLPLVQTSVNISGQPVLTDARDIVAKFSTMEILVVDDENLKKSEPSIIIDLTSGKLTRIR